MMNQLGKALALVQVSFSLVLMVLALAIYFNAVDFGWKQPARYWREVGDKKGQNLLLASFIDKRDAAQKQVLRVKQDQLRQLATAQDTLARIEHILGENHLAGVAVLSSLEKGDGKLDIRDIKFDDANELVRKTGGHPRLGFPALETAVPGVEFSYAEYWKKWTELDKNIEQIHVATEALLAKEKEVTDRLIGEVDKDGNPVRDQTGSVIKPGWHYLVEVEVQKQRELLKELEYIEPLWLEELVHVGKVANRRESLVRRLNELVGERGYLSESEFFRKR